MQAFAPCRRPRHLQLPAGQFPYQNEAFPIPLILSKTYQYLMLRKTGAAPVSCSFYGVQIPSFFIGYYISICLIKYTKCFCKYLWLFQGRLFLHISRRKCCLIHPPSRNSVFYPSCMLKPLQILLSMYSCC